MIDIRLLDQSKVNEEEFDSGKLKTRLVQY